MVILYEAFGSFNTGVSSYRVLISKKSRGTISLTEGTLQFESHKDKVLFQLKISKIEDFFMKNRFSIPIIEIISPNGTNYILSTLRKSKKHYHSSLQMTEDLFRQLTRLILNKDQIILFDTIVTLYPGSVKNFNFKERSLQGHIFLTENYILFKPFQTGKFNRIRILQIKQVIMEIEDSITYITIETVKGNIYSFLPLKIYRGRIVKDKTKNEKFYDILNQAIMYKRSEQIGVNKKEPEKQQIKCSFCENMIKPTDKLCPYCGNKN
ncbi:MAG: hypothetical protein ACFFA0_16530 [Promethearchaeota archaeon]